MRPSRVLGWPSEQVAERALRGEGDARPLDRAGVDRPQRVRQLDTVRWIVVSVWRRRPFPLYPPFLVVRSPHNAQQGSRLGRLKRTIPCTCVIAWQHLLSWKFSAVDRTFRT